MIKNLLSKIGHKIYCRMPWGKKIAELEAEELRQVGIVSGLTCDLHQSREIIKEKNRQIQKLGGRIGNLSKNAKRLNERLEEHEREVKRREELKKHFIKTGCGDAIEIIADLESIIDGLREKNLTLQKLLLLEPNPKRIIIS